jgi:hypothetical protein
MNSIELLVGAILGTIFSIITTIWIEVQRKPKLSIKIAPPNDSNYSERHPAQRARFLGVLVENKALSWGVRWLSRNAASQSSAQITFYHLDAQKVFSGPMVGRWSGSPEPVPPISISGERVTIENIVVSYDLSTSSTLKKDIYPGEIEKLDIAARFDNDNDCFGWNNEAYFSDPQWRNPKWRIPSGRYLVLVQVTTSGEKTTELFRLSNDVSIDDFRLEKATSKDLELIIGKSQLRVTSDLGIKID